MRCTLCRESAAEYPTTTCAACARSTGRVVVSLRPSEDSDARMLRRAALAVRCPFCKASPGSECSKPGRRGRERTKQHHPSRVDAAAGRKAAS